MSTKYFHFDAGVANALTALAYKEGAPVEYQFSDALTVAVQAWHAIDAAGRILIIARLTALGFVEGEQSKPDEVAVG